MTRPARSVVVIAIAVVALVVAAAVVLLAFPPSASQFTSGSPEDVFQRYLTTFQRRDYAAAYGFFSTQAQQQLALDDYVAYARSGFGVPSTEPARVVVRSLEGDEVSKTLNLTIEHDSGGALDVNRWTEDVSVPMVQESGTWKIDRLLMGVYTAPVMPIPK